MATEMKRFTISISSDLEQGLDTLKKEQFYNTTQSEMIRFLIQKGLNSVKKTSPEQVE